MPAQTLKELRALARSRGLRGYSKLSRRELEKLLSTQGKPKEPAVKVVTAPATPKAKKTAQKKPSTAAPKQSARTKKRQPAEPPTDVLSRTPVAPARGPAWEWVAENARQNLDEERIEMAKYTVVPPGMVTSRVERTDLNENIDVLPDVDEPMLCLLPQKPGVVHGYWNMPSNSVPGHQTLRLRLGRIAHHVFEVMDEITLPVDRGRWYFHINESHENGALFLMVGYYETDGHFVSVNRRGIACIPNLFASNRTDRLWWVSEERFRSMYRRAGGYVSGPRLGWTASISSPGGAPRSSSSETMIQAGGVKQLF